MKTNWMPLVLLLALAGCGQDKPAATTAPTQGPRPVRVAQVLGGPHGAVLHATGQLLPADQVKLSFKIGGVLAQAAVQEGDAVRAGQVLARLNTAEIDAQVAQARIALAKAQRDYDRAVRLQKDSVVTLAQLQDARSGLEAAQEGLRIAQFNQQYSTIVAPQSGRILMQVAQPGELMGPGQPVYVLGATGKGWKVRVGLADREVVQVRPGDAATIRLAAFPDREYKATVTEVGAVIDASMGAYPVELRITPQGNEAFVAGIVAQANLKPRAATTALRIPVEALLQADGETGVVYVLQPDGRRVKRVSVLVDRLQGTDVVLRQGPPAGTSVITDGAAYLRDGDSVRVQQSTASN